MTDTTTPCRDCILVKTIKDQCAALTSAWAQLDVANQTIRRLRMRLGLDELPTAANVRWYRPGDGPRRDDAQPESVREPRTCQRERCCHETDGGGA